MLYLGFLVGLVALVLGADWMVQGASAVARSLGVSTVVVGLTLVAWGTSAPELVVSSMAALSGAPALSVGNVLGSNLANLALILGASSCLATLIVPGEVLSRDYRLMLGTTLALPVLLWDGALSRGEGTLLLLVALVYTVGLLRSARRTAQAPADGDGAGRGRNLALSLFGIVVLLGGGQLMVECAVQIAESWGWSERLIGLTIVAIGTSLPELAAGTTAVRHGETELAVGNVVGSNLFNIVLVLGATAVIQPIVLPEAERVRAGVDLGVVCALTLVLFPILWSRRAVERPLGIGLLLLYFGYVGWSVLGS